MNEDPRDPEDEDDGGDYLGSPDFNDCDACTYGTDS
jgi:hypothetical protein